MPIPMSNGFDQWRRFRKAPEQVPFTLVERRSCHRSVPAIRIQPRIQSARVTEGSEHPHRHLQIAPKRHRQILGTCQITSARQTAGSGVHHRPIAAIEAADALRRYRGYSHRSTLRRRAARNPVRREACPNVSRASPSRISTRSIRAGELTKTPRDCTPR